jgi:hypothetical protein
MQRNEKKKSTNIKHCKRTLKKNIMKKLQEKEFERKCRREGASKKKKSQTRKISFLRKNHYL